VIREELARWPPALEGGDGGRAHRGFRGQLVFAGVTFQVLELHLQLVEQPCLALRARAVELATELLDLQLQPRYQRIRAAVRGTLPSGSGFGLKPAGTFRQDHGVGRS